MCLGKPTNYANSSARNSTPMGQLYGRPISHRQHGMTRTHQPADQSWCRNAEIILKIG